MATKKTTIGRTPTFAGAWVNNYVNPKTGHNGYPLKKRVSHLGSEFQSLIEDNTYEPATLNQAHTEITFDTEHWEVVSNGSDAYLLQYTVENKMDEVDARLDEQDEKVEMLNGSDVAIGVLPVSGETNKIYRVPNDPTAGKYTDYGWNGTQFVPLCTYPNDVDDEPTAGSDNLVKSGGVQNELALGAVYDVSAKNPTAGPNNDGKFESLSALLSDANLSTLIPSSVRKGGMSVKFIQSSDNKYVQYMLVADEWSTNVNDWEKINLAKEVYGEGLENQVYDEGDFTGITSITGLISSSNDSLFTAEINNGINFIATGDVYIRLEKNFDVTQGHKYAIVVDCDGQSLNSLYAVLSGYNSSDANRVNILGSPQSVIFNEGYNCFIIEMTDQWCTYGKAAIRMFAGRAVTIKGIYVFDLGGNDSDYYNLTSEQIVARCNKMIPYFKKLVFQKGMEDLSSDIDYLINRANETDNYINEELFDWKDISKDTVEILTNSAIILSGTIVTRGGWKVRVYQVSRGDKLKFNVYNTNQDIAFFSTIPSLGDTGTNIYFGSTTEFEYTVPSDGYIGATYVSESYYVNTYKQVYKYATRDVQGSIDDLSISVGSPYNNLTYNRSQLSDWYTKYLAKEVDDYNRLVVTMVGDSIFGRVDKGASWEPSSPQIAYTPDCNDVNETDYGYQTGHFPPNMWEQIIPYKVLKLLQFEEADVKYFNHSANEVSLSGSWQNVFPLGADSIRAIKSVTANDSAEMSFSAAFLKIVYTCYEIESDGKTISIQFSDDNGVTWKSASELSLTCNIASVGNAYTTPNIKEKFGSILFKGFDVSKTYKVKVTNVESSEFGLWGFETWNNKRVDVIVTAQGGKTAKNQLDNPQRFYSEMSNASLCIYEQPYYNDLGTGIVNRYKGEANTNTVPSDYVDQSFYYCKETGVYTNFGNVKAYKGDYIEYNSTSQTWQRGSRQLDYAFAYYRPNNKEVLKLRSMLGIPVLAVVTHDGYFSLSRPFMCNDGMSWLRNCIALSGLPSVDVSFWNIHNKVTSGFMVDGVHLNDTGVEIYMNLLKDVLLPEKQMPVRLGKKQYRHLNKIVASTVSHIYFGFIFAKKPIVRIYGNNSITISNITKTGFDVSGSGGFEWEAFVE